MNDTTKNFWEVWNNLEPYVAPVIFWRLYHDDQGRPLFYSQEDLPGNYINVTPEQYQLADMRVKVVQGELKKLNTNPVRKLVPAESGTPCHSQDVSVVDAHIKNPQHWKIKIND